MQTYTKTQASALIILRLITAAIFFVAGYYKLSMWSSAPEGMSLTMVLLMKFLSIVEPIGAIALIIGLWTRLAASGLAIIMVGAVFIMQFTMNVGFVTQTGAGWNFPLVVLAGCIVLMAFGPGSWSIDAKK